MGKLIIELTDKCNMNCQYCYEKGRNLVRAERKRGDKVSFLNELSQRGDISEVVLTGGEPLLSDNFIDVLHIFSEKTITILTNGLKKIEDKDILSKLNLVVSLDGEYDVMNIHRGVDREQYNIILKNIEWYIKNAKSTTINTVITPFNISEEKYYPYMLFGNSCIYKFSVPSLIFTPCELSLPLTQYHFYKKTIDSYIEKSSYQMKCFVDVINRRYVRDNAEVVAKEIGKIEYNLMQNIFYFFNRTFLTYDDALEGKKDVEKSIKKIICDFLTEKDCPKWINPYNYCEKIFYEKGR